MLTIAHLFETPVHRPAVAEMIWREFWADVPGATAQGMAERLALAAQPDAVPLCLVALHEGQPVGVVNLVESDDDEHVDWSPWLAGLVVAEAWRGRGVGSALVGRVLAEARRLGIDRVYFGTDGPGFYTRLGAVLHLQHSADFCFMRFDIGSAG
jgi:predicted N-acetyltransferase YhbS